YSDGSTTDNTSDALWNSVTGGTATIDAAGLVTVVTVTTGTSVIEATVGVVKGTTLLTVDADTVAPVVRLTSPSDGLVMSGTALEVSGTVDDVNASVTVYVNGGAQPVIPPDASIDFVDNVVLNVGSNTVEVTASDGTNTGTSGTRIVEVNPAKPDITIDSPAEGLVTSNPSLSVNGTIVGADSAMLRLNGGAGGTVSGNFTQGVTLTEGVNHIVVSGYASGESTEAFLGTSGIRTVTLDTTAPLVTIISPASGGVVNTPGITVTGMVNDPGVTTANLTVNGVSNMVPAVGGSFSQDITLVDGSNAITVSATDGVGNTSSAVSRTVTLDKTKPEVTVTAPANNLLTNVASQLVTGTVSDLSIRSATLYVNGSSQTIAVAPDGSFNQVVALTATQNTIEVTATDQAANTGTSGVVNVAVDSLAPEITISLSDPIGIITIVVSSNEALGAIPTVNVNPAVIMTQTGVDQWTGVYTIPGDGEYTVTVDGVDMAGNPATVTATFAKDTVTIAPDVPVTVEADDVTLVVDVDSDVTAQSITVTQHDENPTENTASGTEAGLFVEIVASGNLTDSIESIYLTVVYDEAEMIARGIDESTLLLYLWDLITGQWEAVPGSGVNTEQNYVYGTVTHLSKYGTFGSPPAPVQPVTELPVAVEVSPGIFDVSRVITGTGLFVYEIVADSSDGMVELAIDRLTVGKTQTGAALSQIEITEMVEPPAPPVDASIIGLTYDLGPDGATFTPPISLTFTYDPAEIPEGTNEEDLVIAFWDENVGEWVELEGVTVDPVTNTITGQVSHFTAFTVTAPVPVEEEVVVPEEEVVEPEEEVVEPEEEVVVPEEEVVVPEEEVVVPEEEVVVPEEEVVVPEEEVVEEEGAPLAWWIWLIVGLAVVAIIGGWVVFQRRRA
ncbi:hypothetical protein ACFLUJ_07955, partial [Chloroflexota bacterium]